MNGGHFRVGLGWRGRLGALRPQQPPYHRAEGTSKDQCPPLWMDGALVCPLLPNSSDTSPGQPLLTSQHFRSLLLEILEDIWPPGHLCRGVRPGLFSNSPSPAEDRRTGPAGPETQALCLWVKAAARGLGGSCTWDRRDRPPRGWSRADTAVSNSGLGVRENAQPLKLQGEILLSSPAGCSRECEGTQFGQVWPPGVGLSSRPSPLLGSMLLLPTFGALV